MTPSPFEQRALALAGVAQACFLVDELARRGEAAEDAMKICIDSLFVFDAGQMLDVYGGQARHLRVGLEVMNDLLGGAQAARHPMTTRYSMGVLLLERQLSARPDMLRIIRSRLDHASFHSEHFAEHLDDVCRQVAAVYQDTVSQLRFRIQVAGSAQHLRNSRVADRIRALLLAAIRSAMLWHQLGGRRWHLLFQRGNYRTAVRSLLQSLE